MLKADLHTHSREDPADVIPYDAKALIDRAAALGYSALAITLHDRQLPVSALTPYARERGVLLIPGIERTIRGKHVLLLNFPAAVEHVSHFDDIRRLKARTNGLVIAPHPFFPHPCCVGRLLDAYADVFDAIELNAFYTRRVDFNRKAMRWAQAHGKPVVGNGDVHRLRQLNTAFSRIDSEADPDAVCQAIRDQRVSVQTVPLTAAAAAFHLADLVAADCWSALNRAIRAPMDMPARLGRSTS